MKVILASKSPRRQELLGRLVDDFEIIESKFDENSIMFKGNPEEYVKELSKAKAEAVFHNEKSESIIISADTVVVHEGRVLGKPKNEEEAYSMLKALSGNTHKVYSGFCVLNTKNASAICDCCCTEVKFSKLTNEQIQKYIKSEEPFDKAGAYGIQGLGGVFVEGISGCYYNVMGLPINRLNNILSQYITTLI
ncbi:Maf-like protein [Clostridium tarantellae]|uniref:dTTP/UTP pyrophosphatase n=1 Tax=Clostridium tarantellae TaxID=39493 RepID=A0A6I1MQD7_9CLOT|nr:Maf-like protein [Clostridium tarantellae]MPQ42499.1 Maf-like protein [Clostridium tarantellae]